jgi:hypothetical protein
LGDEVIGTFLSVVLWLGCIAWGGKIGHQKHRLLCGLMLGGFLLFAGVAAIALMPTHNPNQYPYAPHRPRRRSTARHAAGHQAASPATGTGWPTQPPTVSKGKHARII